MLMNYAVLLAIIIIIIGVISGIFKLQKFLSKKNRWAGLIIPFIYFALAGFQWIIIVNANADYSSFFLVYTVLIFAIFNLVFGIIMLGIYLKHQKKQRVKVKQDDFDMFDEIAYQNEQMNKTPRRVKIAITLIVVILLGVMNSRNLFIVLSESYVYFPVSQGYDAHYLIVELKADITRPYYTKTDDEYNEERYLVEDLRRMMFDLDSEEYKLKMEIVEEFASQGVDYYKEPIPEIVINKAKEDYPDIWEEYLKVY